MRNKIFITIVCLLLVICFAVSLTSCNKKKTEDNKITSIVFLGDSICEGVAGPAPLQERVNYSYYGILGQINGIEAHNRSVSGYQTKHLLDYISRVNDIPICSDYDDIREFKLAEPVYPLSVIATSVAANNDDAKREAFESSIPEFKRFNIVESEVRNVI